MGGIQKGARPTVAPPEEDPNATVVCSSPPCFMHELDPSYLGYLSREEASKLLEALLAAEWGGAAPDEGRLRAVLRRHLEALGERLDDAPLASRTAGASGGSAASSEAPCCGPDRLASMVREALPRIHGDALRRDLAETLGVLERAVPRGGDSRDGS